MTYAAQLVFGALRNADEHQLDVSTLAVRTKLPWRTVAAATRDLCGIGLVERYRGERGPLFAIAKRFGGTGA